MSTPGFVSRYGEQAIVAAATIGPVKREIVLVSGTTTIDTITPNFGGQFGQEIRLLTVTGALTLSTTGNILIGTTTSTNLMTILTFVPSLAKWAIK